MKCKREKRSTFFFPFPIFAKRNGIFLPPLLDSGNSQVIYAALDPIIQFFFHFQCSTKIKADFVSMIRTP